MPGSSIFRWQRKITYVMRLVSSDLALSEVLALSAGAELTLSQLARAVDTTASAAARALEILLDDGVVVRRSGKRPVYRLTTKETSSHVLSLAVADVPFADAIAVGARANSAVEFVGQENSGALLVVFCARSTVVNESRAARFFERVARPDSVKVRYLDHDDVRRDLLSKPEVRDQIRQATVLYGDLDRTFPDRSGHGLQDGRPLHEPHRAIQLPSAHRLRKLARVHQLASLHLFGSAVRTDFRPDSDVDVLVRHRDGVRPSLDSIIGLEHDLERAFGRDVDLIREENLRPELRERVRTEAVSLL